MRGNPRCGGRRFACQGECAKPSRHVDPDDDVEDENEKCECPEQVPGAQVQPPGIVIAGRAANYIGGDAPPAIMAADSANVKRLIGATRGTDAYLRGDALATLVATHTGRAHVSILIEKRLGDKWHISEIEAGGRTSAALAITEISHLCPKRFSIKMQI